MRAYLGDFQVRPRGQGSAPGQILKTVRIVHHRDRMGEKGVTQTEEEPQQGKVSVRLMSLPSDHGRTLPWSTTRRNSRSLLRMSKRIAYNARVFPCV